VDYIKYQYAFLCLIIILFSSCSPSEKTGSDLSLSVSGTGLDGPIANGEIRFFSRDNTLCYQTSTGPDAQYSMPIPTGCAFPLRVELTGGTDLSTNLPNTTTMYSMVITPGETSINISPITTLIYHAAIAKSLRGNLVSVADTDIDNVIQTVVRKFGFGINSENKEINPLTNPINADNIASYTKSNEAIIEVVRRSAGVESENVSAMFEVLGTDMSDGQLDGKKKDIVIDNSATRKLKMTAAQVTAAAHNNASIIAAEVMSNKLQITKNDGKRISAEKVLDNLASAMKTVTSTQSKKINVEDAKQSLEELKVTKTFVKQARASVVAAIDLADSIGKDTSSLVSLNTSFTAIESAIDKDSDNAVDVTQISSELETISSIVETASQVAEVVNTAVTDDTGSGGITADKIDQAIAESESVQRQGAGVFVSSLSNNTITESGSTATFSVYLLTKPESNVIIDISGDVTEASVSSASLTFTENNWNIPQVVTVTGLDDFEVDGDQSFTITLASVKSTDLNYQHYDPEDLGGVNLDNDTMPILSIAVVDSQLMEGKNGNTVFRFQVSRQGATGEPCNVDYSVSGAGSNPVDITDFGGSYPSGMLSFSSGEITKNISISVLGDIYYEVDEDFSVSLSNPTNNAQILVSSAMGKIINDDPEEYQWGDSDWGEAIWN
jgi:hypothetical protein